MHSLTAGSRDGVGGAGRAPFSAALWVWTAPGDRREQYGYLTDGQNVPERESLRPPAEAGPHPRTPGPFPGGQKQEREGTREPPEVPGGSRAQGGQV